MTRPSGLENFDIRKKVFDIVSEHCGTVIARKVDVDVNHQLNIYRNAVVKDTAYTIMEHYHLVDIRKEMKHVERDLYSQSVRGRIATRIRPLWQHLCELISATLPRV